MRTLADIDKFLADAEAQQSASAQDWKDIRDEVAILLAGKQVSLLKYRRQIDTLRKQVKNIGRPAEIPSAPRKEEQKPTVISHVEMSDGKTVCRSCGAALSGTTKAVLEHYEKKHYSEFIKNRSIMSARPYIFVVRK